MNKDEQSQLCMLLAKMRYDVMEEISSLMINCQEYKNQEELLNAINKVMCYSYIDGSNNDRRKIKRN